MMLILLRLFPVNVTFIFVIFMFELKGAFVAVIAYQSDQLVQIVSFGIKIMFGQQLPDFRFKN